MSSSTETRRGNTEDPYFRAKKWIRDAQYASPEHLVMKSYSSRMRIASELMLTKMGEIKVNKIEEIRKMKKLFKENDLSRADRIKGYKRRKYSLGTKIVTPLLSEYKKVKVPEKYSKDLKATYKYRVGMALWQTSGKLSGLERKIGRTNVTIPKAPAVHPRV